ncbi:hypothetical protein H8B09_11890 [Paenibacillus sp. PR3]|uniref:Uncharacterized protein n=1 Tax=Paenibacillus terricola TaxID=2763503 RepID=A0ABR8MW14_9BACL|nr:hypothetical protein [Paenibacillus terricola]MBD3919456.1 hypothetical protein [Paenibacillus terricola]
MIFINTIYVHIRHWAFWWGVHGFTNKSCNDEITLYSDQEKTNRVAYFDLWTLPCLIHHLNEELSDNESYEDNKYLEDIQAFIHGDKKMDYSYLYPKDDGDAEYQVKHSGPMNEQGHKPTYIYVWSKLTEAWDMESIAEHVQILARHFLQMEVGRVVFLDQPTYEETQVVYEEECARFGVRF